MAHNGMFVAPVDDPRTSDDPVGEVATYAEYLRNYRLTLEMKCADLTPEQLATRSVPPSTMSLLGLVRHCSNMEYAWFQRTLQGRGDHRAYVAEDGHVRDLDFDGAVGTQECVEEAFATRKEIVADAEAWLATQADADMATTYALGDHDSASARDILVHVIEEYARHCGHADLLRECIDGRTGQ